MTANTPGIVLCGAIDGRAGGPIANADGNLHGGPAYEKRGVCHRIIGKWGLGKPDSDSIPTKLGFDYFYGYNCQTKAHEYYPEYLWRNEEKVMLNGNPFA